MPPSPIAASAAGSLFAGVPLATGGSEPWQWVFFAALGAWLVGGAVRPDAVPAAEASPADRGVPPATDAGRWYLIAVGGVLLCCTLAACWGAVAAV